MVTEDKTTRPGKGTLTTPPPEESVSGLDVRQLLGLGRANPDPEPAPESVEIKLPTPDPVQSKPREEVVQARPEPKPEKPPVSRAATPVERKAPRFETTNAPTTRVSAPVTPPPAEVSPAIETPMRPAAEVLPVTKTPSVAEASSPVSQPERPQRPAFETFETPPAENKAPELSIDPPAQARPGSRFGEVTEGARLPIPPVSDPGELASLRPSIDPLAARTPLAAARPLNEAAPVSDTPDPSLVANAKLEELASLSERTLEDYESFDDFDDETHQRSKKTPLIILASLLCVGVLAGGVVFAYRQGVRESNQTTLPVIMAETKATKEEPRNPGGVKIPHQNKLIYDRILGEETDIAEKIVPRQEKVVTFSPQPAHTTVLKTVPPAKTKVPPVPAVPGQAKKPANTASSRTSVPANATKKATDELARKLAEAVPPKPVSPPASLTNDGGVKIPVTPRPSTPLTETLKLPAKVIDNTGIKQVGEIVRLETETVTGPPVVPSAPKSSEEKLASIKAIEDSVASESPTAIAGKLPPVLPRRKPPAPAASTRVASTTTPATPSTVVRSSTGAYVIQIAAFRSQEEALSRYAALKRRHSGLLRPYTSFVQRADLGDRGVYYRLRLGPIDGKDKASDLCRSLLSAGERDCLVRSR